MDGGIIFNAILLDWLFFLLLFLILIAIGLLIRCCIRSQSGDEESRANYKPSPAFVTRRSFRRGSRHCSVRSGGSGGKKSRVYLSPLPRNLTAKTSKRVI